MLSQIATGVRIPMNIEDSSCMMQFPPIPTLCSLSIKAGDDRYDELPEDAKADFCKKLAEKLHEDNVCYSGCFSLGFD